MEDFLKRVYGKELTEDEAEEIYDNIMEHGHNDSWQEVLSMNTTEATAFMHGASFAEIARWRYEGWPTHCPVCGESLDISGGGWMVRETKAGSSIAHIGC